MKILALDAALGPFSVALDGGGVLRTDRSAGNDALEAGLGRVAALLADGGLRLADIDRLAVGIGPGSFTGIRIALSFAKALAYGAGLPLLGVASYDVLEPPEVSGLCLTVVSGRPGIICARLRDGASARIACGPTAEVLTTLLDGHDPGMPLTIAGSSEDALPALGERFRRASYLVSPAAANPAATIARLARTRQPAPSLHGVTPDYGEMPAVTVPKAGTNIAP